MTVEKLITDYIDIWSSALRIRSTAGRGNNGKIDQYGIKKLREFILELAVRGKLVPQDPNDEPASELLKRIAAEKAELVKQGKIKKQKPLPEISEDEKPFELPIGWECARLGNTVAIIRGITFPASEKHKEPSEGKVACLRTANVQDSIEWDDLLYVSESFVKRSEQFAEKGDIVMSMANSRELVGKVAYIYNIPTSSATFGGFLSVIRPYGFNAAFLMSVLRSPYIKSILIDSSSQTTNIANISLEKLNPLVISVPPIGEQNRIAFKLEELMSLCDQLEQQSLTSLDAHQQLVEILLKTLVDSQNAEELAENWARISQHFDTLFTTEASIDALKQTILQLAVMGLLIESANFSQRSHLKKHLSFGPRNGLSPSEVKYETDVKVLKLGATSYGYLKLQEAKHVDIDTSDKLHLFLRKGDILIQRGNSSNFVGCSLLIEKDFDNLIYPDLMMKIRTKDELFPEYAALWLSSPFARNYMWSKMTGTSGTMPKISKKVVEDVPIAVPPLAVQHQLVIKIKEIFFLCDSLKSRLQLAQQIQLHLADALTDAALN